LLTPGGLPPVVLFHLGLCGAVFTATSSRVSGLPAGQDPPPPLTPGPPTHPHPTTVLFSPTCRFSGPFAVQ
jgi:hypothetical protein